MDKNIHWLCGLVPIGKKDHRGPLSDQFICLEQDGEASLMTIAYKRVRNRTGDNEKDMDLHQKHIEVFSFLIFFFLFKS